MAERLLITVVISAGLLLLWWGWQVVKERMVKGMAPHQPGRGRPTLLYFTGEFCAICKLQQAPIVEMLATQFGEQLGIQQVDAAAQPDMARQYRVMTLPTTVILDHSGQAVKVNYGLASQEKLNKQLSGVMNVKRYPALNHKLQRGLSQ